MAARRHATHVMIRVTAFASLFLLACALTACEPGSNAMQDGGGGKQSPAADEVRKESVTLGGRTFKLELALDHKTRFKGLSGRSEIAEDGGMLFAFAQPQKRLYFVMRDCPVPIGIIFLDATGRIVAMHEMTPEAPRTDEEKILSPQREGDPPWAWINADYESRLKRYPSRHDAQFVIEIKGGLLEGLKLEDGQRINLDTRKLARLAKEADAALEKALREGK